MHLFNSIFFLPFFSSIFIAKAQQGQSIVKPGSLLTPTTNSSQPSNSGLHAFGFYKQGNGYAVGVFLVGFLKRQYFGQPTDNPPVPADVKLSSKIDGNIVLQSVQNTETNITTFPEGVTSASMKV